MKTTPQILRDAAAILDMRGWLQGDYARAEDGPVCVSAACALAAGLHLAPLHDEDGTIPEDPSYGVDGTPDVRDAWYASLAELELEFDCQGDRTVIDWNDDPFRTIDEVKAALLAAAGNVEEPAS